MPIFKGGTTMKKVASLFLTLALCFSVCIGVSAQSAADISKYNSVYSWQQAAQSLDGVYEKATDGLDETDYKLSENAAGAESVGMSKGFYHFFYPGSEAYARAQADYFWNAIKDYSQQLLPVCDVEVTMGCDAGEISRDVAAFCDQLKRDGAQNVVIYTYRYFTQYLTGLAQYPLWIADPFGTDGPQSFYNWTSWAAWQYSWSGQIAGIDGAVDLNKITQVVYISQPVNYSLLQFGSTGDAVATLQSNLNKLGYNLTTDGFFGPLTRAAVVSFQQSHGLDPDGVVGPLTQGAINAALSNGTGIYAIQQKLNKLGYGLQVDGISGPCTDSAIRSFQRIMGISVDGIYGSQSDAAYQTIVSKPTLKQGIDGYAQAIRYIQWRCGASADGVFGPVTDQSVKAWQSAHDLYPDGIVGPNTWAAMIGG
jgi:peptidoglycan hydrolase-like protein with peptidoglycan-binding domain/GH25 family lysozyme M1 (1,4-beta-N-acetylmuramidase)